MIKLKTPAQIKLMEESGKISAEVLKRTVAAVKPGITLRDLDLIAERTITELGAKPSFKSVDGYKYSTCINVNEGIVHGLPNAYKVKVGDLVSVDLGALYKGFHTDVSYTTEVQTYKETKFLNVGKEALEIAIAQCVVGNHIGDISNAIQGCVESFGYSVSRDLVGHGVGFELHEDPYVPGYGKRGSGEKIEEGMVLAIEVIYQKGKPAIVLDEDGWTLRTKDRSLSALFEATVAATINGPKILTPLL